MRTLLLIIIMTLTSFNLKSQKMDFYNSIISFELVTADDVERYQIERPISKRKAIELLLSKEYERIGLSRNRFHSVNFSPVDSTTKGVVLFIEKMEERVHLLQEIGLIDEDQKELLNQEISEYKLPGIILLYERISQLNQFKDKVSQLKNQLKGSIDNYEDMLVSDYEKILINLINNNDHKKLMSIFKRSTVIDLADYISNEDYLNKLYEKISENVSGISIENIGYEIVEKVNNFDTDYINYELITKVNYQGDEFIYGSFIKRPEDIKDGIFFGWVGSDFYKSINYALSSGSNNGKLYKVSFEYSKIRTADYRNLSFIYLYDEELSLISSLPGIKISNEDDTNVLNRVEILRFIEELIGNEIIANDNMNELVDLLFSKFNADIRQLIPDILNLTTNSFGEISGDSKVYEKFIENLSGLKNLDVKIEKVSASSTGFNKGNVKFSLNDVDKSISYSGIDDWFDLEIIDKINTEIRNSGSEGQFYGINTVTNGGSYIFLKPTQVKLFEKYGFFGI